MNHFKPADLAVVIPTRDRWSILAETLEALGKQTVSGFETIVVVDGTDQTPPDLLDATVLVKPHGGPGAARNFGVEHTQRQLVLFLGDDMVPDADLVERHLDIHQLNPKPNDGVLGHVVWHDRVPHSRLTRWLDWSSTQFDYANIVGDDAGWGRFYSCNVSLKRQFFVDAGGFDEDFVFDYEDLDCGYRLNERGMSLHYQRQAIARHLHSYDWSRLQGRWASRARAEQLMMAKHKWFAPWFANMIDDAGKSRAMSGLWPVICDRIPERFPRVKKEARDRAHLWYLQHLSPQFLNAWATEGDLGELREYLGEGYDQSLLVDHRGAVDREEAAMGDEDLFYRSSKTYLYDLTAFAMSGTKVPYLAVLRRLLPPGAALLDYGCGIGSDGLRLLPEGYRVDFADFDNPSTAYLRWRLQRRGSAARVWDVDKDDIPTDYDAVYCFDVIEHIDEPEDFLRTLESKAAMVVVNLLEPLPGDTELHRPLPIERIVRRATSLGLVHYGVYYGRSHLIAYHTQPGGPVSRARSEILRGWGRVTRDWPEDEPLPALMAARRSLAGRQGRG